MKMDNLPSEIAGINRLLRTSSKMLVQGFLSLIVLNVLILMNYLGESPSRINPSHLGFSVPTLYAMITIFIVSIALAWVSIFFLFKGFQNITNLQKKYIDLEKKEESLEAMETVSVHLSSGSLYSTFPSVVFLIYCVSICLTIIDVYYLCMSFTRPADLFTIVAFIYFAVLLSIGIVAALPFMVFLIVPFGHLNPKCYNSNLGELPIIIKAEFRYKKILNQSLEKLVK